MGLEEQRLATDALVWVTNVATSSAQVFCTRLLMSTLKFNFPTTISSFHFLSCSLILKASELLGFISAGPAIPVKHTALYTLVGCVSLVSALATLNSLGVYQMARLGIAPVVCLLEVLVVGRQFSSASLACAALVLTGVGLLTLQEVTVSASAALIAAVFVGSTALQQVLCGRLQAMHQVAPHHLLAATAPVQGCVLLLLGPGVDRWATGLWVSQWEVNVPGIEMLAVTCLIATAVNTTQFVLLGRFTATSFQVLGHAKSLLVLVVGVLVFQEAVTSRQTAGVGVTLLGLIAYSYLRSQGATPAPVAVPTIKTAFNGLRGSAAAAAGGATGTTGRLGSVQPGPDTPTTSTAVAPTASALAPQPPV